MNNSSRSHWGTVRTDTVRIAGNERTVCRGVDVLRQLGHCDLESGLNGGHDLLVTIRRNERDGKTLGTEAASTTKRSLRQCSIRDDEQAYPTRCRYESASGGQS